MVVCNFADVKSVMTDRGIAHMGTGRGKGENRAKDAVTAAIESPLLETTIEGATGIILNIKGGIDVTLEEVYDHIKIKHSRETNCISLSSNANVILDYVFVAIFKY